MDTIKIELNGNTWRAKHSNPEVRSLFGTDTLPTPYLAATPRAAVIEAISKLNPEVTVS